VKGKTENRLFHRRSRRLRRLDWARRMSWAQPNGHKDQTRKNPNRRWTSRRPAAAGLWRAGCGFTQITRVDCGRWNWKMTGLARP